MKHINTSGPFGARACVAAPSILFSVALICPVSIQAAWLVEPSANIETRYEDNGRGQVTNEESSNVSSVGLQARLRQVSEVSEVSVLGGVSLTKYAGEAEFEDDQRESIFLEARSQRRLKRGNLQLSGSFRRQDTLRFLRVLEPINQGLYEDQAGEDLDDETSGRDTTALDELPVEDELLTGADVDLGAVERLVQRDTIRLSPSFSYALNPRTSLLASISYQDVSWSDANKFSALSDSTNQSASVGLQWLGSARDTFAVTVSGSEFDPDDNVKSDSETFNVSWTRRLDGRTTLRLSAGQRNTSSDFYDVNGEVYSARVNRRTNRGSFYGLVERSVYPSGYGDQVETDRIGIGYTDQLSDRLNWRVTARAFSTEDISGGRVDRNRDYIRIEPALQYAISEQWQLRLSYSYTWVDRESEVDEISMNAIGLSMEYVPRRRI